jgi:hypothetical protein
MKHTIRNLNIYFLVYDGEIPLDCIAASYPWLKNAEGSVYTTKTSNLFPLTRSCLHCLSQFGYRREIYNNLDSQCDRAAPDWPARCPHEFLS